MYQIVEGRGPITTPDLDRLLTDAGMNRKQFNFALNWLKDNGHLRVKWLGGLETLAVAGKPFNIVRSPWLTLREAAEYLRVSQRTMRSLVAKEQVTAYRIKSGGALRFKAKDLDRVLIPTTAEPTPLTATADSVLAELWDNEHDAVYDAL